MDYIKSDKQSNDNKTEVFIDAIKKAAKAVHIVGNAYRKCGMAYNALSFIDKREMWEVLQLYLRKYKDFINNLTILTGCYVFNVDKNFYEQCSVEDIQRQLENIIGFVYAKEALTSTTKETFKQCLKKILKSTKMFTDTELAML